MIAVPLVRVSSETKKKIDRIKDKCNYDSVDEVVWNGIKNLKGERDITEPSKKWDLFSGSEDFSL